MKTKMRKDVLLILTGAVLALASFGINWTISSAIDRQLFEVDIQLQDIDRYLSFSTSSALQAFELRSASSNELAISQLMYYQVLTDQPDDGAINTYNSLIANSIIKQASAVTAIHAAVTGFTIEGSEREKVMELSKSGDFGRATAELAELFNKKLEQYQIAFDAKVVSRRAFVVTKKQLVTRRTAVGHFAHFVQLLGILIILAKDIVTAKTPSIPALRLAVDEQEDSERLAA